MTQKEIDWQDVIRRNEDDVMMHAFGVQEIFNPPEIIQEILKILPEEKYKTFCDGKTYKVYDHRLNDVDNLNYTCLDFNITGTQLQLGIISINVAMLGRGYGTRLLDYLIHLAETLEKDVYISSAWDGTQRIVKKICEEHKYTFELLGDDSEPDIIIYFR